jgi:hypothetical protein
MSKAVSVTITKNVVLLEEWVFVVDEDWDPDWDSVLEQVEQATSAGEKPFKQIVVNYDDNWEDMDFYQTADEIAANHSSATHRELK